MEATSAPREFTLRAVALGIILGFVFGVGNAYLGLKVGITISASIPAAVMSMAILRAFSKNATTLENNIVQTIASAGTAVATGTIFTIPALTLLGEPPSLLKVFFLTLLGGFLGVLLMIPLRHHMVVVEDKNLPFPEGRACAAILRSRESTGHKAMISFYGIIIGVVEKVCSGMLHLWSSVLDWSGLRILTVTIDVSPALIGVGYLIGVRYGLIMLSGGLLAWWVLIPMIEMFGLESIVLPGSVPIGEMSDATVWSSYVRYIGTGAVALGGLVSLARLSPKLYHSMKGHFTAMIKDTFASHPKIRTERDLNFIWVVGGLVLALLLLYFVPSLEFNLLSLAMILVFSFVFVGLTCITVGIVGTSSNPVSGMIILTLLATTLIFLSLDWIDRFYLGMAMGVGCVVSIAIALPADTSQDLKTGFLLSATPYLQQIGAMIGIIVPSIFMGWVLQLLQSTYGLGSDALPAPQATLMSIIVSGVIEQNLPFILVSIGVVIGIIVELLGVRALPFALGIYLPLSTTFALGVGGVIAWLIGKVSPKRETNSQGVLLGSGYVAGDALTGVVIALFTVLGWVKPIAAPLLSQWVTLASYIVLIALFMWLTIFRSPQKSSTL